MAIADAAPRVNDKQIAVSMQAGALKAVIHDDEVAALALQKLCAVSRLRETATGAVKAMSSGSSPT